MRYTSHSRSLVALGIIAAASLAAASCSKKDDKKPDVAPVAGDEGGGTGDTGGGTAGNTGGGDDGAPGPNLTPVKPLQPKFAPAGTGMLSIELPDTFSPEGGGGGAGLRLQEGESGSSQGYQQIKSAVGSLQGQLAEATKYIFQCDIVTDKMFAKCDKANANWTTCEAAAGEFEVLITKEYIAAVYGATGEVLTEDEAEKKMSLQGEGEGEDDGMPIDDPSSVAGAGGKQALDGLTDLIGTVAPSPHCIVKRGLTAQEDGVTRSMRIDFDGSEDLFEVAWNEDKSFVRLTSKYGYASEGEYSWNGDYTLKFDRAAGSMRTVGNYVSTYGEGESRETWSFKDTFDFNADAEKMAKHGVNGTFRQESNDFKLNATFSADDDGGSMNTEYVSQYQNVTGFTLSAMTEEGVNYVLAPETADTNDVYAAAIGNIWGDGSATPTDGSYWGPATVPAATHLWKETPPVWDDNKPEDEQSYQSTYDLTAIVVNSVTSAMVTDRSYFTEGFDAFGNLEYACGRPSLEDDCVAFIGDNSDASKYDDYSETNDKYAADLVQITISGSNAAALGGQALYIVPAGVDLSTVDPYAYDYAEVIGYGNFYGDWDDLSATDLTGYEYYYYGSADQLATAQVYVFAYDDTTGLARFELVSGATLTQAP